MLALFATVLLLSGQNKRISAAMSREFGDILHKCLEHHRLGRHRRCAIWNTQKPSPKRPRGAGRILKAACRKAGQSRPKLKFSATRFTELKDPCTRQPEVGPALKACNSIAGFQPESGAITYSYGIPQDEAARTGTSSPDIAQASFTGAAVEFLCKFPPYSATVIVLSPLRGN